MVRIGHVSLRSNLLGHTPRLLETGWALTASRALCYVFTGIIWGGLVVAPSIWAGVALTTMSFATPKHRTPASRWSWWIAFLSYACLAYWFVLMYIRHRQALVNKELKVEWLILAVRYVLAGLMVFGLS